MWVGRARREQGFTLIELLVAIAIIGLLASIVVVSMSDSRERGRDSARSSQAQELLKAVEMYYSDTGGYPADGVADGGGAVQLSTISVPLRDSGYLSGIPADPSFPDSTGYHYCSSNSGASMALIVNIERAGGTSDYCAIGRGPEWPSSICTIDDALLGNGTDVDALDLCAQRF